MSRHIPYIDGLKGFCALGIIIFHYLLAFDTQGFVGWNSGIAPADTWNHFWEHFPLSFFSNASYVLYMFFAIIGFLPAYRFFHDQDMQWIQKQALIRYFRFVPYTFFTIMLSYIFFTQDWFYQDVLGHVLQEPWNIATLAKEMHLGSALWAGLFGAMMVGAGEYVSSLWCMHIIFLGSYVSYAILFFFGKIQHRYALYFFLWLLLYNAPIYVFFIVGIAAADILQRKSLALSTRQSLSILALGFLAVCLGEAPWNMWAGQSVYNYGNILQYILQSLGILAMLLAICHDKNIQKFFMHKVFLHCSRYGFEYILAHIFVLFSVSSWMFVQIHAALGYGFAFVLSSIVAIPLNMLAAMALGKLLQPMASWLSKQVLTRYLFHNNN